MKWLVVLALIACGGKETKVPAIDSLDRSCKADPDCVLAVDVCCTGCGGHLGAPVNRLAWENTRDARNARCSKQQCPDFNCAKPPDCREEGVAICKAGICDRVMQKTAACTEVAPDAALAPDAAASDDACETVDDCILYTVSGCCDRCIGTPMNRAAGARKQKEDEAACANKKVDCPMLDCKRLPVDCVNKKCVQR